MKTNPMLEVLRAFNSEGAMTDHELVNLQTWLGLGVKAEAIIAVRHELTAHRNLAPVGLGDRQQITPYGRDTIARISR